MPERGGDTAIEKLGIHRIPIPVPFPQAGGPVNVVAIEEAEGGIALFDTGLGTRQAEAALVAGLAERGFSFADVRRIFLTHGHIDHYGLAAKIRSVSGATVFVSSGDRNKVAGDSPWRESAPRYRTFLRQAGADFDSIEEILLFAAGQERFARRLAEPLEELEDGARFSFARCDAEIVAAPGHTPGLVCARLTAREPGGLRILVADDHLLEEVSPNPILEIFPNGERFRALPTYFESLTRIEAMDFDWVIPGHGTCFRNHRRVIESLRAFYARRQDKLLGHVPRVGATPLDLVYAVFPRARPGDLFLMLGEILGNLDLLEQAGRVSCRVEEGRLRYFPTASGPVRSGP